MDTGTIVILFLLAAGGLVLFLRSQAENNRQKQIMAHQQEWGNDVCEAVIKRRVGTGMTKEMVLLAWGKPIKIDQKENTASSHKERWVYGQPRKAANYIWFTNDKVTKTKTS